MAITLDMGAADFELAISRAARRQTRIGGRRRRGGGRDHRRRAGARRRCAHRIYAAVRSGRSLAIRFPHRRRRNRRGGRGLRSDGAASAGIRPRARPRLSSPPEPERRFVRRRSRRRARLALAPDRLGRPLCSRRRRELSVLGDHERGAGEGRRLPAPRHGRADARRQAQSAGARRRRKSRA